MYTRQAKKAVPALADTVPFFGEAEGTTHGKTVNPLPRRGASIRSARGTVAEQGGRSQGGEDYNFFRGLGQAPIYQDPLDGSLDIRRELHFQKMPKNPVKSRVSGFFGSLL